MTPPAVAGLFACWAFGREKSREMAGRASVEEKDAPPYEPEAEEEKEEAEE